MPLKKSNEPQVKWHYGKNVLGNDYWSLSILKDDHIYFDKQFAWVLRNDDGSWDWFIFNTHFVGREPSRRLAMLAVHETYEHLLTKLDNGVPLEDQLETIIRLTSY